MAFVCKISVLRKQRFVKNTHTLCAFMTSRAALVCKTRDNLRTGFRSHTVVTRDLRVHAVWDDGDNDDDGDVYPRKAVDLD